MDILHSTPMWIGFNVYILLMLALSLRAHQGQERVSLRSAALWSLFWLANGMLVNGVVWYLGGPDKGLEFLTGYLIEESLSVDNLFVMLSIFAYFSIPPVRQHRVLFWGILGAIVLRGAFILVGTSLVERFHWLLYFFGAFLVFTGIKMGLRKEDGDIDPDANIFVRLFRRVIPVTGDRDADHFIERRGLGWAATPMLVALVVIETSDVMFAFDSIPAIFSITTDAFIVYASNICAVLGLRSLYFLLERIMGLFRFLKYGLAFILSFVGIKMLIVDWVHIPVLASLGVVGGILALTVLFSLLFPAPDDAPTDGDPPGAAQG